MVASRKKVALVTGSSGLVGSEVVDYFCRLGWEVHGVDNREIMIRSSAQNRAADIYIGDCGELFSRTAWRPRRSPRRIVEDVAGWAREERGRLEALWAKVD